MKSVFLIGDVNFTSSVEEDIFSYGSHLQSHGRVFFLKPLHYPCGVGSGVGSGVGNKSSGVGKKWENLQNWWG